MYFQFKKYIKIQKINKSFYFFLKNIFAIKFKNILVINKI